MPNPLYILRQSLISTVSVSVCFLRPHSLIQAGLLSDAMMDGTSARDGMQRRPSSHYGMFGGKFGNIGKIVLHK
jgi:hypothetical protein